MAILAVDAFKESLVGGGARANMFEARVSSPAAGGVSIPTPLFTFMCRAASIPGQNVAPVPVMFKGREIKVAGDRVFDPWTITVYNDTNFQIRNEFEKWSNALNSHAGNVGQVTPVSYMADMEVDQLDQDGTVLQTYKFVSAWPSEISPIELTYDQQGAIEEFQVVMQYQYWTHEGTTS